MQSRRHISKLTFVIGTVVAIVKVIVYHFCTRLIRNVTIFCYIDGWHKKKACYFMWYRGAGTEKLKCKTQTTTE